MSALPATDRPLLLAPLFAPTAGWTSRTVAQTTGQSQSAVARAWARAYSVAPTELGGRLPAAGLRLVAAAVDSRNSALVLTCEGPQDQAFTGSVMRSPRRPPLQTMLAADLLATTRSVRHGTASPADGAVAAVLQAIRRRPGAPPRLYVVSRRPAQAPAPDRVTAVPTASVVEVVVDDPAGWQGLLVELVRRCTRSTPCELLTVQHAVMEWARSDRRGWEWTAFEPPRPRPGRTPSRRAIAAPQAPQATSQTLAEAVLEVLLERLTSGRLAAGDRVTESFLARSVHAARSQVRDALRSLAAAGLLDLEPHRGAAVPTPQTADVVETYAARRALGALVVRRAAHGSPGALVPVEDALRDLVETGRTGNAHATGEADLRFQDALARSTGMRRIPRMFCDLTAQLRLFIAVMGLDYTYSIPGMCDDDTALLEHIRARDETAAARSWHRKIDDAATYMTTQLTIAQTARRPRGRM
jgi:DNA-binding GntR family transcriptional regulator